MGSHSPLTTLPYMCDTTNTGLARFSDTTNKLKLTFE